MKIVISGSGGLVGSEASEYFGQLGHNIVGIDNDMRSQFFGQAASTRWNVERLVEQLGKNYAHHDVDVRNRSAILELFKECGRGIELVIHAAAQPSHDWAAKEPFTDFDINATGTLNVLEATRQFAPEAVFIFLSTNKVYGDNPNRLPFQELETRYEIDPSHTYANGIREDMAIDGGIHSLFGASKLAADTLVQEYGKYFGMRTVCFRGGTLTGPRHSAASLHGFLAYVMRCNMIGIPYLVLGYKGKQVRDAIHTSDLISALHLFSENPRSGETYNIGGGRFSNCSVLEAIHLSEEITGKRLDWSYTEEHRVGDHVWWISDNGKFRSHYPDWDIQFGIPRILQDIHQFNLDRWKP